MNQNINFKFLALFSIIAISHTALYAAVPKLKGRTIELPDSLDVAHAKQMLEILSPESAKDAFNRWYEKMCSEEPDSKKRAVLKDQYDQCMLEMDQHIRRADIVARLRARGHSTSPHASASPAPAQRGNPASAAAMAAAATDLNSMKDTKSATQFLRGRAAHLMPVADVQSHSSASSSASPAPEAVIVSEQDSAQKTLADLAARAYESLGYVYDYVQEYKQPACVRKFVARVLLDYFKLYVNTSKLTAQKISDNLVYKKCVVPSFRLLGMLKPQNYVKEWLKNVDTQQDDLKKARFDFKSVIMGVWPSIAIAELAKCDQRIRGKSAKTNEKDMQEFLKRESKTQREQFEFLVVYYLEKIKKMNAIDALDEHGAPLLFYVALYSHARLSYLPCLVDMAMKRGSNPNIRDAQGRVALLFTIDPAVKKLLEEHGADINFQDNNNETALHTACKAGDIDVVEALLIEGINFKIKNKSNQTAYGVATPAVKEFLDANHSKIKKFELKMQAALSSVAGQQKAAADVKTQQEKTIAEKEKDLADTAAKDLQEKKAKKELLELQKKNQKKEKREQERWQQQIHGLVAAGECAVEASKSIQAVYGKLEAAKIEQRNQAIGRLMAAKARKEQQHVFNKARIFAQKAAKQEKDQQMKQQRELNIRVQALIKSLELLKNNKNNGAQTELIADGQRNLLAASLRLAYHYKNGFKDNKAAMEEMYKMHGDQLRDVNHQLDKDFVQGVGVTMDPQDLMKYLFENNRELDERAKLIERLCDGIRAQDKNACEQAIQDGADIYKSGAPMACARLNGFFMEDILALQKKKREADIAALKARNSSSSSAAHAALSVPAKK